VGAAGEVGGVGAAGEVGGVGAAGEVGGVGAAVAPTAHEPGHLGTFKLRQVTGAPRPPGAAWCPLATRCSARSAAAPARSRARPTPVASHGGGRGCEAVGSTVVLGTVLAPRPVDTTSPWIAARAASKAGEVVAGAGDPPRLGQPRR